MVPIFNDINHRVLIPTKAVYAMIMYAETEKKFTTGQMSSAEHPL